MQQLRRRCRWRPATWESAVRCFKPEARNFRVARAGGRQLAFIQKEFLRGDCTEARLGYGFELLRQVREPGPCARTAFLIWVSAGGLACACQRQVWLVGVLFP